VSAARHRRRLAKLGISPVVKSEAGSQKYPYVVFSAPPSGSQDYVGEVRPAAGAEARVSSLCSCRARLPPALRSRPATHPHLLPPGAVQIKAALGRWDGSGSFVFTSSNSVCAVEDGSLVTEDTPTVALGAGASTDKLLQAEEAVRQVGRRAWAAGWLGLRPGWEACWAVRATGAPERGLLAACRPAPGLQAACGHRPGRSAGQPRTAPTRPRAPPPPPRRAVATSCAWWVCTTASAARTLSS
jgi:hypothetical protein